ncbi:MAG: SoxR reducing system RseC family protein, partial [Candidatus Margulisiibacteriota bacterium]
MQPLERGRVVWVKPGSAEIELVLTPKCKQCSACEISSSGKIIIEADNQAGAKNGDLVELQVSPAAINLFPLIF